MIYSKKEKELIKKRIIELLGENGNMKYSEITEIILNENLARTHHVVGQILQNGCKDDEKFKGEDLFLNLKFGMWGLSENCKENQN